MGLFLDVWLLKTKTFLLVDGFQHKAEEQGCYTQAGQHDQWSGVVELGGVGDTRIGGIEHLTNKQGEQPKTNVLNPENQSVGRTRSEERRVGKECL